jgi:Putative beta-barrel porin-2, OmpL-like. bbp2
MLRKISLSMAIAMAFFTAKSQDSTKTITYSGSLDAYYRYNFADKANNYTSFTNSQNSFELGMASIKAEATSLKGKAGAVIDLGFGRRAEEFSYYDGDSKNGFATLSAIKQAYITYEASKKVKITAGKFATHVGYELLDAPLNRNYSMSYMFTNGPFFHTGVKADIKAGPVAFMVGLTNYTDQTTSTTTSKNFIAQVSGGSKNEKIKFFVNYSGFAGADEGKNPSGLKSLSQFDAVVTAVVTKKFNVGYNGTVQNRTQVSGSTTANGSWIGNALYFNYDYSSKIGYTLRSEYISDNKTVYFGTKHIFANTISLNAKVGDLIFVPELRFENSQSNIYLKNNGSPTKSTASGLIAVMYKF